MNKLSADFDEAVERLRDAVDDLEYQALQHRRTIADVFFAQRQRGISEEDVRCPWCRGAFAMHSEKCQAFTLNGEVK